MSNLATKSNIVHNTMWLLIAEFGSRFVVFFSVVALTNYLGDTAYGELAYAFSIANLCVVIADFGLSTYLIKEIARDSSRTSSIVTTLLGLKLILSIIALFLLWITGSILGNINMYVLLVAGGSIIMMNARMFVEAFFRAQQKMYLEAITKIASGLILAVGLAGAVYTSTTLYRIADIYLIASVASVVITLAVLYFVIAPFFIRFTWKEYSTTLRLAWPFAASIAINYIFNYMDSAMLGFLNQKTAVAWYTAAYKPIFFMTAVAGLIISAFFPTIAKLYTTNKAALQHTVERLLKINILLAIPLAVGGTFVADKLITLLYIEQYAPAGLVFKILCWSTALIYIWAVFGNSVQACDGQKVYMRGFLWGSIINIVLNLILIPYFSLYGAAIATTFTQLFLVLFMYRAFTTIVRLRVWHLLWRPALAAVGMAMVLWLVQSYSIWIMLISGGLTYGILLFMCKGITRDELRILRSLWKK